VQGGGGSSHASLNQPAIPPVRKDERDGKEEKEKVPRLLRSREYPRRMDFMLRLPGSRRGRGGGEKGGGGGKGIADLASTPSTAFVDVCPVDCIHKKRGKGKEGSLVGKRSSGGG